MKRGEESRQRLIECAAELFSEKVGILLLESAKSSNKQTFQKDLLFYHADTFGSAMPVRYYQNAVSVSSRLNS